MSKNLTNIIIDVTHNLIINYHLIEISSKNACLTRNVNANGAIPILCVYLILRSKGMMILNVIDNFFVSFFQCTTKLSPYTIAASVAMVIGVTLIAIVFDKFVITSAQQTHKDKDS